MKEKKAFLKLKLELVQFIYEFEFFEKPLRVIIWDEKMQLYDTFQTGFFNLC